MFKNYRHNIVLILVTIIVIGAFLRLYKISDYMSFLGDEGRDVLIVKRMIVDKDFTLLGPITSVGLMHLGPIYYYFMVPFLWLFNLNPVGPAIMVAFFSVATIFMVWKIGSEFWHEKAGLISALLYALSPLVIAYSHSSWNPNILPFWAGLLIYSLLKTFVKNQKSWFFLVGLSFGVAIQLHYVALVFLPVTVFIVLWQKRQVTRSMLIYGFIGWLLVFSPFILFELRHQFINTKTVWEFISRHGDSKTFGFISPINKFWDLTVRLFWRLIVIENAKVAIGYLLGIFIGVKVLLHKKSAYKYKNTLLILFIWYVLGVGLLSMYTGSTYDYYLMFAFPFPFIISGIVLKELMNHRWGKYLSFIIVVLISYWQIKHTAILSEPNRIVKQTYKLAQFVKEKTQGQPYNFGLIALHNSDHAYRYFLEISGHPPVVIENFDVDPQRKTVTEQLFVICEDKVCQPLGHSRWEIAGFGRAEITDEWQVDFFKVFRLVAYKG